MARQNERRWERERLIYSPITWRNVGEKKKKEVETQEKATRKDSFVFYFEI